MTLKEAITVRHSVRQYTDKPLPQSIIEKLKSKIAEYNNTAGLHMQLVTNEPQAFANGLAKYGKFVGVKNYIAMVCSEEQEEVLGYYGEQLVLLSQTLGLNSCWVGLTFKKQPNHYKINKDEKLKAMIALGYGKTQGVQHPQKKEIDTFISDNRSDKTTPLPDWFIRGTKAALLAPTAVNQQKFFFLLNDNDTVEAKKCFSILTTYTSIDLGIAKCHFEIAAGKENFIWK